MHILVLCSKNTHTWTSIIVRTLNDKCISPHLTVNTQPKLNSNSNLKATSCPLKTSPIFLFASGNVYSGPPYVHEQTGKEGERENMKEWMWLLFQLFFTHFLHTYVCPYKRACGTLCLQVLCQLVSDLYTVYNDMFLCSMYCIDCM